MATATYTFRVEGMHCGSCALLIDDALEDLPGVRSTLTSDGVGGGGHGMISSAFRRR